MRRISIVTAGLLLAFAGAAPAATLWQSGTYSYDGQGNIRAIGSDIFYYDSLGRVKYGDAGSGHKQEYTYDDYGNLIRIQTDGTTENVLGVNPSTNRLTDTTKNVFGTYDSEGNMLSYIGLDTFSYDRLGSTTRSKVDGVEKIHIYSASDERIANITVNSNGVATRSEVTLRDPSARVLRHYSTNGGLSGSWTWEQDYVYRGGALLAAELPTGRRQFHPDHLGTPRLITDGNGATISLHTYYPFGAEVTAPQQERLKFTGHERDNPNLDYMHARYYRPMAGRFLSVDPIIDLKVAMSSPQGWNRYTYVRNNPLRYVDPDGRVVRAVGTAEQKKQELEWIHQNLHPHERALVTLNKKGEVQIKRGAKGFSVAFNDLKNLVASKTVTELHVSATAKQKLTPGPSRPSEVDLRTGGGGLTVPAAFSMSGNVEVYVDPRGNDRGVPSHIVFGHELFGHALDIVRTGRSSEASAVYKENLLRFDQGLPLRPMPKP